MPSYSKVKSLFSELKILFRHPFVSAIVDKCLLKSDLALGTVKVHLAAVSVSVPYFFSSMLCDLTAQDKESLKDSLLTSEGIN